MDILSQLATSMGDRSEAPNITLAEKIVLANDDHAITELIELLAHKTKGLRYDSIKVLYEVGVRKPTLIASHLHVFQTMLTYKDNRLQWGAMTALDAIASKYPDKVAEMLTDIVAAADSGSVITRDHAVGILIKLCSHHLSVELAYPLLIEQLLSSPINQLPMYAENTLPVIDKKNKGVFIKTLQSRLDEVDKESKKKRIEKVIKKALII